MATPLPAQRDCNNCEDRISELPDDIILTYILPAGMKEAAKTSIISKRWRYLWTNRTDLDFNYLIVLPNSVPNLPGDPNINDWSIFTVGEKNKYINWVNQVVGLHCSPYIDRFKVAFKFDGNDGHHIDKWVRFALMKNVQNLQLRVYSQGVVYTLSLDTIKPSLSVIDSGINCLKTLYLINIDVSGDVLEYLLSQCCLLEQLCVIHSRTLVRLRVVGLCSKLNKLKITSCWKLEELVVDAANLVCLRYGTSSHGTKAVFKSMPALVDAKFYSYCFSPYSSFFHQISHLATQITTLYLDLLGWDFPTGVVPIFCNLKRLRMRVDGEVKFNLYSMNRFLKAFPTLRELKVEIVWNRSLDDELLEEAFVLEEVDLSRDDVEVANMYGWQYFEREEKSVLKRTQLPNLEELQVVGFSGYDADVDLILFIVLLASNLKTIICDPSRFIPLTSEEVAETRSRAAKLMKLIRPKISLVNF